MPTININPSINTNQITVSDILNTYFSSLIPSLFNVILSLIAALLVLIIGWVIAFLIKIFVDFILSKLTFKELCERLGIAKYFEDFKWEDGLHKILAEISFWIVFIVFIMVSFDILGLNIINQFLNDIVKYLPKAIAGGFILFFGFILGELTKKVLIGFLKGLEKKNADSVGSFIKGVVIVFAFLVALNVWGVNSDIINILMLGIVLFVSLAGGLAFGLGGQEIARDILENLRKKF